MTPSLLSHNSQRRVRRLCGAVHRQSGTLGSFHYRRGAGGTGLGPEADRKLIAGHRSWNVKIISPKAFVSTPLWAVSLARLIPACNPSDSFPLPLYTQRPPLSEIRDSSNTTNAEPQAQ